jgi:hypothetical protein
MTNILKKKKKKEKKKERVQRKDKTQKSIQFLDHLYCDGTRGRYFLSL